jgi:hypothetical protein
MGTQHSWQEAGGRRQEAGGRRQEAGGRRQEAGGRLLLTAYCLLLGMNPLRVRFKNSVHLIEKLAEAW